MTKIERQFDEPPSPAAISPSSEPAAVCEETPFKPKGLGARYAVDQKRSVAVFPGENKEVIIEYRNGERKFAFRLSEEAVQATIIALMKVVGGPHPDPDIPPAA